MITLEHVAICASNTVALKEWYVGLFGFKTVYDNQKDNPTFILLMDDESMMEIYPAEKTADKLDNKYMGIRHLAFGTDHIESEYEKLLANKVEVIEALKVSPNGVKTVFFRDPEGNIIHFVQRPDKLY